MTVADRVRRHLAAEYVIRFARGRAPLPAVALTTDASVLTAGANDYGFDTVFERQVRRTAALLAKGGGRPGGDVDLALVVPTLSTARAQELHLLIGHIVCEHVDRAFAGAEGSEEGT